MANLRWIFGALLIFALVVWVSAAQAYDITATVTADNDFILYYGNATGSSLFSVGPGPQVVNGVRDWKSPVSYSFTVPAGDFLYVLAWNDLGSAPPGSANPNAWLGQFLVSGYQPLYSDLAKWQFIYTTSGNPSISGNSIPLDATVQSLIGAGGWASATPQAEHFSTGTQFAGNFSPNGNPPPGGTGDNIWNIINGGPISGISPDAYWIWFDTFNVDSLSEYGYAVFRADLSALTPAVPLPASVLLLGSGLVGLGLLGYRRKNS